YLRFYYLLGDAMERWRQHIARPPISVINYMYIGRTLHFVKSEPLTITSVAASRCSLDIIIITGNKVFYQKYLSDRFLTPPKTQIEENGEMFTATGQDYKGNKYYSGGVSSHMYYDETGTEYTVKEGLL